MKNKFIILLVSGFISGLVCAEIVLRFLHYPYIGCKIVQGFTEYTIGRYDPVVGWSYTPGRSTAVNGITYTFGQEGYRTDAVEKTTDRSKPVILIVGDSTLFGDGLNFTDTFGYKLQKRLNDRYEVLNFAVQGYGLDQTYLRLGQIISVYKPQYVISDFIEDQDYRNAIQDRRVLFSCYTMRGTKPLFTIQHNALVLTQRPQRYDTYDTPRLRLVWRRFQDLLRQELHGKQVVSKLLYQKLTQTISDHHAILLGINYLLDARNYEAKEDPLVVSYGAQYKFEDGFHPNAKGTTRLVDDFLAKFALKIE